MTPPIRQFVDGPYGQIHVRRNGAASKKHRPLVCLHMFPQSSRNFEALFSLSQIDRLVVAPDFPGYGESSTPDAPIDAEAYAESVWATMDALGLTDEHDQIDVFGIHAGAKLSVELAYQRPKSVRRMVLSSAAVFHPDELEQMKTAFSHIPLDEEGTRFSRLWQMLITHRGPGMTYEMMATGLAEMLRGGEAYEWGHHAVFQYNQVFPERLKSLDHQITILNPKDDLFKITPRSSAYLQNGTVIDKPEWGHGFMEVYASELWQTITNCLDSEGHAASDNVNIMG